MRNPKSFYRHMTPEKAQEIRRRYFRREAMTEKVLGEEPCDMCGEPCHGRRCEDCRRACAEKGMTKQPSLYGVPPELQRWFSRPCPEY